MKRRPAIEKSSTMRRTANKIFTGRQFTIGVDLEDRWSFYCVLDESGKVILEEKDLRWFFSSRHLLTFVAE